MSGLKKHIYEEKNGLHYTLNGDYYLPDLKLPEEHRPIGKYGRMHREYLREVHPARLNTLTLTGELWTYLADLNEQAQKRLDTIYDKIGDAEDLVSETEDKLSNIQKDKITGDNIYNYLLMFDSVYDVLSDMEKKQFYNALLTDIQIYEEEQDKQIIKSIGFKFPVFYDGKFTKRIIRDKEKTVETVAWLQRVNR